ncbi:GntR family transcriptional regulator [Reinekea sp.]|jgi:GntR family transcriptional regulator|uniref:GntR family transcriptional regulator n=1 Tax=Reinekea sp. TaxID=1970455 RepID=UPI003989BEE7
MNEFDSTSAIYLQVADLMSEKILAGEWLPLERVPSVREVASLVKVNPNTVMRSFAHLQDNAIIFNKRGVGYFVSQDGVEKIIHHKKSEFIDLKLPKVFREADVLSITPEELARFYEQYIKESS